MEELEIQNTVDLVTPDGEAETSLKPADNPLQIVFVGIFAAFLLVTLTPILTEYLALTRLAKITATAQPQSPLTIPE